MKRALIPVLAITVLIAMMVLPGCDESTPPGETITEKKNFTNFTYVEVGSAFEVDITRSDTYSVTISADESLFDYVEVSQQGTRLKIYLNPRHIFTDFTLGNKVLKAVITMPNLYGLDISGASNGDIAGFSSISDFNLTVSGASTLDMSNISVGDVRFEVSGASRVSGNLTAADVNAEVSGASNLNLSGTAERITLNVSGASGADLTSFPLGDADVILSGASNVTINVEDTMNVNVSGASSLYFIGNPTMGTTNVSGASTIKHK
jgi:hypothetical protein